MSRLKVQKLRFWLFCILILVIFVLFYLAIIPFGSVLYVYKPWNNGSFWEKLSPDSRLDKLVEGSQRIIGNPVYINLRTSRPFDIANIKIKYRFSDKVKISNRIIEIGSLVDSNLWRYDLKPIHNGVLNKLKNKWNVLEDHGVMLFSRNAELLNLEDFFQNMPNLSEIALYNYKHDFDFKIKNHRPLESIKTIKNSLKGDYSFYFYVGEKENIFFDFLFTDLNQSKGIDPVVIYLYFKDQVIAYQKLDDDGVDNDSGIIKTDRSLKFDLALMPGGVYKIEVRAQEDIISKKILTKHNKLSFINKIWIVEGGLEEGIQVFTDSKSISFNTVNPGSLQVFKLNDEEFAIKKTYKQYSMSATNDVSRIFLKKGDIILAGDGVFSFSKKALMNPNLRKVNVNFKINHNVNYVLADYSIPKFLDGWYESSAKFDLRRSYRENGKYNFLISIPGLKADDDIEDWVEIKEIEVELSGKSIYDWFREKINSI